MIFNKIKNRFKNKYNVEDRKAFLFCYLMILIPVAQFLIFWVYVNANSIFLAFKDDFGHFTLNNFKDLFHAFTDEDMYGWNLGAILGRTVLLWFIVNIVCTPLIMFSTYILFKKIAGHYVFRTIFAIPSILGAIIWTTLMRYFVSANGPILELVQQMGVEISADVAQNGLIGTDRTAFPTLIAINVIPNLIACNLILTGAFNRIPPELFECARLDGISFFRGFIAIAIPLAWPTIVINLISSLSTIFTANGNVFLYTMGQFETATMGFYLYYMVFRISNSVVGANAFGYPAAVGLFLTIITLPVILVGKHFLEKTYETVEY